MWDLELLELLNALAEVPLYSTFEGTVCLVCGKVCPNAYSFQHESTCATRRARTYLSEHTIETTVTTITGEQKK
jgi:hypothetical protein